MILFQIMITGFHSYNENKVSLQNIELRNNENKLFPAKHRTSVKMKTKYFPA